MRKLNLSLAYGIFLVLFHSSPILKAQNGLGDNFNNISLSCNWAPNTYKLTEIGNELRVVCTVPGNAYNTFDLNFPTPLNIASNPLVTLRIKSGTPFSIRIDLKDANNSFTNANPITLTIPGNNTYATYSFNFTGRFNQIWPNAGTVNASAITALNIFINPGGTAFSGTIYLDDVQIGTGGATDGGASNCIIETVAGFSSDIRLNQIGFYPKAPKTAVFKGTPSGSQFYIKTLDLATTLYTGTINGVATWNYSNESVRVVNFTPVTTPGTYVIEIPGIGTSYSFKISEGVHLNVNKAALKAFYYNRSSTALDAAFAGAYARAAGHLDNAIIILPSASSGPRPAGTSISAPKGWYDAGDYNSYIVNSGISTYTLLSAYEQFKSYYDTLDLNIPESGNSLPDILDEIKWNLDWMLTMQDPNDGGVYNKKTNANFDPWVMPSAATSTRYMCAKGSAASFDFAAVMAVAYRIYLPYNPTFANTCLTAATAAYNWGVANPNITFTNPGASGGYPGVVTGEYGDNALGDEYEWAATEMYISTQNNTYYAKSFKNANTYNIPDWASVRTLGLLSLIKNRKNLTATAYADTSNMKTKLTNLANVYSNYQQTSAYRVPMGGGGNGDFAWGSNAIAANQGMILLHAYRMTNNIQYYNASLSQLDYLLGRNPTTYSFVTGHGKKRVMNPHHRPSAADGIVEPVPGWLAGGPQNGANGDGCANDPNPALAYVDGLNCYTKNEVTINWNAPFVFLSSGLEVLNPFAQTNTNQPPHAAGTISGLNSICQGVATNYSITTVTGATSYQWTIPTNATITGQGNNSVNVIFGNVSGAVSVLPINNFGTGTGYSLLVNVNSLPSATGTISGISNSCANQTGLIYTVSTVLGANNYIWQTPSSSNILQGNGTNTVTVNLGANSGNISVQPINSCGTGAGSNLPIIVNAFSTPGLSISATTTMVCNGTLVSLTANGTNTGTAPTIQWFRNGIAQTIGTTYSLTPTNGDLIRAVLTIGSGISCYSNNTATSNGINLTVNQLLNPSVSIAANQTSVCAGSQVSFTATGLNTGSNPTYQWFRNGIAQTIGTTYSFTPTNGDLIRAVLTIGSGISCFSNNTATSNGISLTVNPILSPSVSIAANQTSVCAGSQASFTATGLNTGSNPIYQWFRNGFAQTIGTTYSLIPSNGDLIRAVLTIGSGISCYSNNTATSNGISLTVNPILNPSVSIAANQTSVCAGSQVSFTATGLNTGSNPTYQWFRNGIAQTIGTTYSLIPSNGDLIRAVLTIGSGISCYSNNTATSNGINLTVNQLLNPSVSIAANQTSVCAGSQVSFTATGLNTGSNPTYQWFRNGISQTIGTTYSLTPSNGDLIRAVLTIGSGISCFSNNTATSNGISLTVNPILSPSVSIAANQTSVCTGSQVSFTATGLNTGSNPTYLWFRNGQSQSTGLIFTYAPTNSDNIKAVLTPSGIGNACISSIPTTSNGINITVANSIIPAVSISASKISACTGTSITLTAIGINGGNLPIYQWMVNGNNLNTPTSSSTLTVSNFATGSKVNVTMVSNSVCANPSTSISNVITLTSIPNGSNPCLPPSINSISGLNNVISNQTGIVYSVGSLPGTSYSWSVPSGATITSGFGTNTITVNFGNSGGIVSLIATNAYGSTSLSKSVSMVVTDLTFSKIEPTFILFPNPNSGEFTAMSNSEGNYLIINELGQTIQQISLNSNNNFKQKIEISLSGMYLIIGSNDGKVTHEKLIVTK